MSEDEAQQKISELEEKLASTTKALEEKLASTTKALEESQRAQARLHNEVVMLQDARREWNRRKVKRALASVKRCA